MDHALSAVAELRHRCHVSAALPEGFLLELQRDSAIRVHQLDAGESLTSRNSAERHESLVVLQGEVEVWRDDERAAIGDAGQQNRRMLPLDGKVIEVQAKSPRSCTL